MTLTLILKLAAMLPQLQKEGTSLIDELKSNDDEVTKARAAIAEVEAALETIKAALS